MIPLAVIRSRDGYAGLHAALRARWKSLGISGETMDELNGIAERYASKLLGPNPPRRLGKSLGPVLGSLGCMLVLVEDQEMMARIAEYLPKPKNTSMAILPVKKRRKRNPRKGNSEWGRQMNYRRTLSLSWRKRKKIARTAIRARWAKTRIS